MMSPEKKRDFSPIKREVDRLLSGITRAFSEDKVKVDAVWQKTTGGEFDKQAYIGRVTKDTIYVHVLSSAALSELRQFYRTPFQKRLREAGLLHLEKLVFKKVDH